MSIKQTTPQSKINRYIGERVERIKKAIIYNLRYIGEACVNAARDSGSYTDRTGNLRSSVGYVIVCDGKIMEPSDFDVVKEGGKGAKEGARFAKEAARQFPEGIVLIVVAGMNYAAYVSARGYDVIDSAELLADKLVPQMLHRLGFK